jgi:hypothetical protein
VSLRIAPFFFSVSRFETRILSFVTTSLRRKPKKNMARGHSVFHGDFHEQIVVHRSSTIHGTKRQTTTIVRCCLPVPLLFIAIVG